MLATSLLIALIHTLQWSSAACQETGVNHVTSDAVVIGLDALHVLMMADEDVEKIRI